MVGRYEHSVCRNSAPAAIFKDSHRPDLCETCLTWEPLTTAQQLLRYGRPWRSNKRNFSKSNPHLSGNVTVSVDRSEPPFNMMFPGSIWVPILNGLLIRTAVFAEQRLQFAARAEDFWSPTSSSAGRFVGWWEIPIKHKVTLLCINRHTKNHLGPFTCLDTIHERYRHTHKHITHGISRTRYHGQQKARCLKEKISSNWR